MATTIDAAWLTANAPNSDDVLVLDTADEVYTLGVNVTRDYHGVLVVEDNITLDLGGFTLTHDNKAANADVANGGFEADALDATAISNWDESGAATAIIKARDTTNMLWGDKVLRLDSFTTDQVLVSDAITIDAADTGKEYAAHFSYGGVSGTNPTLTLDVLDASDDSVIATRTGGGAQGMVRALYFIPGVSSVKIRITFATTGTTTVDIDFVTLRRSRCSGIIASRQWAGEGTWPAWESLSAGEQSQYDQVSCTRFTVRNGTVAHGANSGFGSYGVYAESINGLTVGGSGVGVVFTTKGFDPQGVYAALHGYNAAKSDTVDYAVAITHNTITMTAAENIADRNIVQSAITLNRTATSWAVTDNTIIDAPQMGINLSSITVGDVNVSDNNIDLEKIVTNGYAIRVAGTDNVTLDSNVITGVGRGIIVDGDSAAGCDGIDLTTNTITLSDKFDRENAGPLGSACRGVRIRNNTGNLAPVTNVLISGNIVTVESGADAENVYGADALRLSFINTAGNMDDAGITVTGNTLKAIATGASDTARAMNITGCNAEINVTGINNSFESNDIGVQILDGDGPNVCEDVTFTSNTFIDSADGHARTFKSMSVGYSTFTCDNVTLQKNTFSGGATNLITWSGSGSRTFYEGDVITATIEDGLGAGLPVATVTIGNGTLTTGGDELSNGSGEVSPAIVERKWVDSVNTVTEGDLAITGRKTGRVSIQSTINTAVTKTPVLSLPVAS